MTFNRASREIRAPLEGEYVEGEAVAPAKREPGFAWNSDSTEFFTYIGFSLAASKKDLPGWRIGLNWLCGVEMDDGDGVTVEIPQVKILDWFLSLAVSTDQWRIPNPLNFNLWHPKVTKLSPSEEAEVAADFLLETPWKRRLVNLNAILVMAVAMFFWGFYA